MQPKPEHTISGLKDRAISVLDEAETFFEFLVILIESDKKARWVRSQLADIRAVRTKIGKLVDDDGTFRSHDARQRLRNAIETYLAVSFESPFEAESLLADMYPEHE